MPLPLSGLSTIFGYTNYHTGSGGCKTFGIFGFTGFYSQCQILESLYGYTNFYDWHQRTEGIFGYTDFQGTCRGWGEEELYLCELFEITLANGTTVRFNNSDMDFTYSSNFYQAIPIRRGSIGLHSDLQVDKIDVSMGLIGLKFVAESGGDTRQLSIPDAIRKEYFRNSSVIIRSYNFDTGTAKLIFEGTVADCSWNKGILTLSVASVLDLLNEKVPRVIYTEMCNHKLYDSRCSINRTSSTYSASGTVVYVDGTSVIGATILDFSEPYPEGWWFRGEIKITGPSSSLNYDLSRSVIQHWASGGTGYVRTSIPFVDTINVGDTFIVYAGCDRTGSTCMDKFNNYNNFFGFEYIPRPETLMSAL